LSSLCSGCRCPDGLVGLVYTFTMLTADSLTRTLLLLFWLRQKQPLIAGVFLDSRCGWLRDGLVVLVVDSLVENSLDLPIWTPASLVTA